MTKNKNLIPLGWKSKSNIALLVFLVIGGYLLFTEHRAHLIQALPWILVLGCIVMHLFMHHGHDGTGDGHENDTVKSNGDEHER